VRIAIIKQNLDIHHGNNHDMTTKIMVTLFSPQVTAKVPLSAYSVQKSCAEIVYLNEFLDIKSTVLPPIVAVCHILV
jgi:hypothetical protein